MHFILRAQSLEWLNRSNQMCTITTFLQVLIPKSNVTYYFVTLGPSGESYLMNTNKPGLQCF